MPGGVGGARASLASTRFCAGGRVEPSRAKTRPYRDHRGPGQRRADRRAAPGRRVHSQHCRRGDDRGRATPHRGVYERGRGSPDRDLPRGDREGSAAVVSGRRWGRGHAPRAAAHHRGLVLVSLGAKSGSSAARPETRSVRVELDRHGSRRASPAHRFGSAAHRQGGDAARLADRRRVLAGRPRGSHRTRRARLAAPVAPRADRHRVAGVLVLDRTLRALQLITRDDE